LPNPTEETTRVVTEAGTDMLKKPSALVEVPTVVPLAVTEAPETGDPSLASVTLPETVLFWAIETWDAKSIAATVIALKNR
jgi:hypothetical protein